MQHRKKTLVAVTLLAVALCAFGLNYFRETKSSTRSERRDTESFALGSGSPSRSPAFVSVYIDPPAPTFLAGQTGRCRVSISINTDSLIDGGTLDWSPDFDTVAASWLSVSRECGVTFEPAGETDGSRCHILVTFTKDDVGDSKTLSSYVDYFVDDNIEAGKYNATLDVMAELVTVDGRKVQDVGIVMCPFGIDTHLGTKLLMLLTVCLAIFLFVTEWVRIDVVAIIMMILLPELGLLKAGDAFRGLSSNAVIAIIGVMIISFGLNRTGLVNRMLNPILAYVRKGESRLVVVFSGLIAAVSSVMQNTGAAVLFLPAIRLVATRELKIHMSRVLMPIGMAAILGGTLTMIGTSPLILLNDILPPGMAKFGFLELTPIGLALAISGIAYLSTIGMKILSSRNGKLEKAGDGPVGETSVGVAQSYPEIQGPFEIQVPRNYLPNGGPQEIAEIRRKYLVNIVALSKPGQPVEVAPNPRVTIEKGMALCVYGNRHNIERFAKNYGLMLMERPIVFRRTLFNPSYAGLAEMIISPRSSFVGRSIKRIRFRETYDINAVALHQSGEVYYRDLADRKLQSGDAVLIHGQWQQIQSLRDHHQNFVVVTSTSTGIHKPEKAKPALLSFAFSLLLMLLSSFYFQRFAYNPIPLSICLMAGALTMIVTKVITISEAYRAIDTRTVFLLGGLIPLGMAVDQTGTAQWIAQGIVSGVGGSVPPLGMLVILAVLSCGLTMVVSNVGACALLIPLGISLANQTGFDPRLAAIVIGIGVSNSFILPTHQVNALYMGPGEYRTKDYIKVGGGLSLVYIVVLVSVTYLLYS